jgi:hypothetical protein
LRRSAKVSKANFDFAQQINSPSPIFGEGQGGEVKKPADTSRASGLELLEAMRFTAPD